MLKALELIGFKSFADKTRFEFPQGITVVVGPNGSGKSNLVDAIKWVLGEQSAKSLRGKEMADVIFNGSGSRRALNSAEVTLTLDNSKKLLAVDTPEVHVTRRVYRSGEGEYLINRQPCRLRDFRDIFAGTGIATEAYSVIEQGKVDVMLQSSPRERRVIFEEAAGISRFKVKKLEALRRLERVDQNLLRLSDIVDEVDNRLRSVRMQATKARRYRQYTGRLQELRTQVAAVDWRRLSEQLQRIERQQSTLHQQRAAFLAEAEALDVRSLETEIEITRLDQQIRKAEARIAGNRESIVGTESMIQHQRSRCGELEHQASRYRRQLSTMTARVGDIQQQLRETTEEVEVARQHYQQQHRDLASDQRELTELTTRLDRLRGEYEVQREQHLKEMREATTLSTEITSLETQALALQTRADQCRSQIAKLGQTASQLAGELKQFHIEHRHSQQSAEQAGQRLAEAQALLAQRRRQLASAQKELADLQGRYTVAHERAEILQELEDRREGLSSGVKQALAEAEQATDGPFCQIRGLVADVIEANVDMAPLIDAALGPVAAHLVVSPGEALFDLLKRQSYRFKGRVGFVSIKPRGVATSTQAADLTGRLGVVGRATDYVRTVESPAGLLDQLLGSTWIVGDLEQALSLAAELNGEEQLVTLAGELVEADGTVVVGPSAGVAGLISRRSELRALAALKTKLAGQLEAARHSAATLEEAVDQLDTEATERDGEKRHADRRLGQLQIKVQGAGQRCDHVEQQLAALGDELAVAEQDVVSVAGTLEQRQQQQLEKESQLSETEAHIDEQKQHIAQLDQSYAGQTRKTTSAQIDLAKSQQRLEYLQTQLRQFEQHRQERDRGINDARTQLAECTRQAGLSGRTILTAESEIALLYLNKEEFRREVVAHTESRDALRRERSEAASLAQSRRNKIRKLEDALHAQQLSASEIQHERTTLADRLREDYSIELAELEHPPSDEELHEREAVETEIADLRRKVNNMGGVNIDALQELEELETRFNSLSTQFKDLSSAKGSLQEIIDRINDDSRRLFGETLETVRSHFQELFRKLFGGGRADIVLEEDVDLLDSGIEIVARPPGKEPRSISLLSGGEKTLTCVALLLSIFRSRPSPFCVLDEVDAALDEANIERFTAVLREFLTMTQFIVVTHSKKTMTAANTLYGVTMQESGVSKRVSVRFEDVSEDGQISESAIRRTATEEASRVEETKINNDPPLIPSSGADAASDDGDDTQAA